jgi:hypothetical protein
MCVQNLGVTPGLSKNFAAPEPGHNSCVGGGGSTELSKMKLHFLLRLWTWLMAVGLSFAGIASAQTYYVRAGATGANNGSDWNNAFTALPSSMVRGATYYVATGTYGTHTFSTAVSGTTVITVKKATVADHGTNVGWQDSYGIGTAQWSKWSFTSKYFVMDGQVRDADWAGGYGFKVKATGDRPVDLFASGNQYAAGNITIRYTDVEGLGVDNTIYERLVYGIFANNVTLQYCYFHDTGSVPVVTGSCNNWLMEYCLLARNSSNAYRHAEGWAASQDSNIVIRYNRFEDIEGTGQIVALGRGGSAIENNDNWEIYGNTFFYTPGNPYNREGSSDGAIAVINNQVARNWKIYNNSFINMNIGLSSRVAIGGDGAVGHSAVIQNNFWWNSKVSGPTLNNGTYTFSHNRFDASPSSGANAEVNLAALTTVFVNYNAKDFRLVLPTLPGAPLAAPHNQDPNGRVRGSDGVWDRGAFEYLLTGGADTTAPVITGVATVSVGATNVIITWVTDEAATTVVQYGPTASYGSTSADASHVLVHTRTISGLSPNTTYNFRVQSADVAGNTATSGNFTFQTALLDVTVPAVSITALTSGSVVSNTISLTASASDNVAVVGVQFLIDGQPVGAEDTVAPYSYNWDSWTVANGSHAVQARARDAVGNITTSTAVNIQVLNQSAGGVPSGLVGYWALNESSGTTSAGNPGGNATLQTGASFTGGRVGNALALNGSTGHAVIPDSPALRVTNALTLSFWVKHTTLPASGSFMHYLEKGLDDHDNYGLGIGNMASGLQLYFEFEDTTGTYRRFYQSGNLTLAAGAWAHLTVVFDDAANLVRYYKDGALVGSTTVTQSMNPGLAHPVYIGRENFAAYPWPLNAAVDEVRIFTRALTAVEVAEVYQTSNPAVPAPPTNLRIAGP